MLARISLEIKALSKSKQIWIRRHLVQFETATLDEPPTDGFDRIICGIATQDNENDTVAWIEAKGKRDGDNESHREQGLKIKFWVI